MSGGLIQLVAQGIQDIFLTKDPQITFFKVVYRRHTNFSSEMIIQRFNRDPNFGDKVSATISRAGDLISHVYIVADLPSITQLDGDVNRFRWVDHLGFVMVNNVEIEIGGSLIDKQFGEWMYIWYELTGPKNRGFDKMIGNISKLKQLEQSKDSYRLYIPLQFWFCRMYGSALPIVNLQYNEVKINLELNEVKKCYKTSPTHHITLEDDLVNFIKGEKIYQDLGNDLVSVGEFVYFDKVSKKLYYNQLTKFPFKSISSSDTSITDTERKQLVRASENSIYHIVGNTTKFKAMPKINATEKKYNFPKIRNLNLKDCYLLVEYLFLDEEERKRFATSRHEYLIEQVQFSGDKALESLGTKVNLNFINPCKEIVWVVQYSRQKNVKEYFNFTNNAISENGENIVESETVQINGKDRVKYRSSDYFDTLQMYQHHNFSTPTGINSYSFSLNPINNQPSGTLNMSKVSNLAITMRLKSSITPSNSGVLKCYVLTYNILRVANGLAGLVFNSD